MNGRLSSSHLLRFAVAWTGVLVFLNLSCTEKSGTTTAPYQNSRDISDIVIEEESFNPKLTWLGGYASVIGVNRDSVAALDSSLIWLIYVPDNNLHYPVQFGELPDGAQDLTSAYGGSKLDRLTEDNNYTFWVMKAEAWQKVSMHDGKKLFPDSVSGHGDVTVIGDSIFCGSRIYTEKYKQLDVYVNLSNIKPVGKLANIFVEQPITSNNPKITWEIKQVGVTDTLLSAMGIVLGQSYNPNNLVWEVWSVDSSGTKPIYGKENIIAQPVVCGDSFEKSHVFVQYPPTGLERNKDYYIWIANKDWDGEKRLRVTNFYAYVTFHTW